MSDKFRIKKEEYTIPRPKLSNSFTKKVDRLAKQLEKERSEGKFSGDALNIASKIPKGAFKIVADYIKKNQRKIYGGTAINMLLPRGHKIYKASELPDYDFFSPDPWTDAVNIANLLYKAGHKYVQTRAGVHKGTYKVFADFWPVADVTYLPEDLYKQVGSVKKNGFKVISPAYVQMTLYDIISKPREAPNRWPQVARRQKLLERWSAPKYNKKQCGKDFISATEQVYLPDTLMEALEVVYKFAQRKKFVHYGALAYNKYLSVAGGKLRIPVYYYELLCQNSKQEFASLKKEISQKVKAPLNEEEIYQPYKDMNRMNRILYLTLDGTDYPIFILTELSRCIPYKYLNGRYYCSIDYLFYELYQEMFDSQTNLYAFDMSCLIRYLYYLQQQYYKTNGVKELDNTPFQRFVTKCKGPYVDVIREDFYSGWVNQAKLQDKTLDVVPQGNTITFTGVKGRKIRINPESSKKCRSKSHSNCKYPCAWNKNTNSCGDIPFTGYKPGYSTTIKEPSGALVKVKVGNE